MVSPRREWRKGPFLACAFVVLIVGSSLLHVSGVAKVPLMPQQLNLIQPPSASPTEFQAGSNATAGSQEMAFSEFHCVCGPPMGNPGPREYGCQPLWTNVFTNVRPDGGDRGIDFYLHLQGPDGNGPKGQTPSGALGDMKNRFKECQQAMWYPEVEFELNFHILDRTLNQSDTWCFTPSSGSSRCASTLQEAQAGRKGAPLLWLQQRWGGFVPYHNMFDHGLFQTWLGLGMIRQYIEKNNLPPLAEDVNPDADKYFSESGPLKGYDQWRIRNKHIDITPEMRALTKYLSPSYLKGADAETGDWNTRISRVTSCLSVNIVMDLMFGRSPQNPKRRHPIHTIWESVVKTQRFEWYHEGRIFSPYVTLNLMETTPQDAFSLTVNTKSDQMLWYVRLFSNVIKTEMTRMFGPHDPVPGHVFIENRPVSGFIPDGRARGIQPHTKAALIAGLQNEVPWLQREGKKRDPESIKGLKWIGNRGDTNGVLITDMEMNNRISLRKQWHIFQSARVFMAGEGSFISFQQFSNVNTTWICILNHTRSYNESNPSMWHSQMNPAYDFVKLIFYVIDNGIVPPLSELWPIVAEEPFRPGVYFVGADEHGHRKR